MKTSFSHLSNPKNWHPVIKLIVVMIIACPVCWYGLHTIVETSQADLGMDSLLMYYIFKGAIIFLTLVMALLIVFKVGTYRQEMAFRRLKRQYTRAQMWQLVKDTTASKGDRKTALKILEQDFLEQLHDKQGF